MGNYKSDVKIEYEWGKTEYTKNGILSSLRSDILSKRQFKYIHFPEVWFKIILTNYTREKIVVERSKLAGPEVSLDPKVVVDISNNFSEVGVYTQVWIDKNGNPLFITAGGKTVCVNRDLLQSAESFTAQIAESILKQNTEPDIALLYDDSSDEEIFYLDKDVLIKFLYQSTMEWLDGLFPGLIVANDMKESKKISQVGLHVLMIFYAVQKGIAYDPTKISFGDDLLFHVEDTLCSEFLESFNDERFVSLAKEAPKSVPIFGQDSMPVTGGVEVIDPKNLGDTEKIVSTRKTNKPSSVSSNTSKEIKRLELPKVAEVSLMMPQSVLESSDDDYNFFTRVSWPSFLMFTKRFLIGCDIILNSGEVIVGKNNIGVIEQSLITKMAFFGPKFPTVEKRGKIELYMNDYNSDVIKRVDEFLSEFGFSVHAVRLSTGVLIRPAVLKG